MACSPFRSRASQEPAASQGWERFRHVITRLYIDEDKTVDEVKQYMEEHHGFSASITMYKKKLGMWNAFKNLRSSDVLQILRLKKARDAERKQSIFAIRGKPVDTHSLQVYISRNPWLLAKAEAEGALSPEAARDVTCCSPGPLSPSTLNMSDNSLSLSGSIGALEISKRFAALLPSPTNPLRGPNTYAAPEDMFQTLHAYLDRSFATGVWMWKGNQCVNTRGRYRPSTLLNSFVDRVMTGALGVSRQVNPVIVRHALDASFAILVRVFRNPPPDLIPKLLTLAIRLSRMGRDEISRILIRFSRDLSFALRGPRDPLTVFWQGALKTNQTGAAEKVFIICLAEFEKRSGPGHDLPVSVYLSYFDIFERQKPPQAQLQSLNARLEKIDRQLIDHTLHGSLLLERQLAVSKLELAEGRPEDAEAALLDLEDGNVNPKDEPFRSAWLGYVRWVMGNMSSAEESYRNGVLMAERAGSRDILCEALWQLERFLLWTGQPLEAEGVRAQRLRALQRAGSIVSFSVDTADNDSTSRRSEDARSGGPSVVKIHIASGASGEKWRPSAFSELTEGPCALLKSGGVSSDNGDDGAQVAQRVGGQPQKVSPGTSPARRTTGGIS